MWLSKLKDNYYQSKDMLYDYMAEDHFKKIIRAAAPIGYAILDGLIACATLESTFPEHYKSGSKSLLWELISGKIFIAGAMISYDSALKFCRALQLNPMKKFSKPSYNELFYPLPNKQYHYPIKEIYENSLALYELRKKQTENSMKSSSSSRKIKRECEKIERPLSRIGSSFTKI